LQDALFGYPACLYTGITFLQGSQQPSHRDVPVFHTSPENFYFGIWFALEDATLQNGTLIGVRGGHRIHVDKYKIAKKFFDAPEEIPEQDPQLWRAYQKELYDEYTKAGLKEESIELSKGDIFIWHPLFPHGGGKIIDKNLTRRSVVFHTVPEGVPVFKMDKFFDWERNENELKQNPLRYKYMKNYRLSTLQGGPRIVSK